MTLAKMLALMCLSAWIGVLFSISSFNYYFDHTAEGGMYLMFGWGMAAVAIILAITAVPKKPEVVVRPQRRVVSGVHRRKPAKKKPAIKKAA